MKHIAFVTVIISLFSLSACAKDVELTTDQQKLGYTIGHRIGQNLKRQDMDVDTDAVSQAIKDVLSGAEAKLSQEDMQATLLAYQKKKAEDRKAQADKNLEAGKAFLEANKKKADVKITKSGLQYKVIKAGKGKSPKPTDTVTVNYRGTLINGQEFDSSYKRGKPATFPVKGVIKGWQEALTMMKPGAKWHVAIPSELAYGPRGAGPTILPNSALIFEIELLEVKKSEKK